MKKKFRFLDFVLLLLVVGFLPVPRTTIAQTQQNQPRLFMTWQAYSYTPPPFPGKILPTSNSPIAVSVEVVNPTTGKIIDLGKQTIYWYINDNFFKGGQGVQNIYFRLPAQASSFISVRAQLPNLGNGMLLKTIQIPLVRPEVAIEAPYPDKRFGGASLQVKGFPYFFNVANPSALNFTWNVNGETPPNAENPAYLVVNINPDAPSGSTLNIRLTIQNPSNSSESASKIISLTLTK
jgi:hypothetical protein